MNLRKILACVLIILAATTFLSQTYFILKNFSEIKNNYILHSSIEVYFFSVSLLILGCLISSKKNNVYVVISLAITLFGLWLFLGRELYIHYIEMPKKIPNYLKMRNYWKVDPIIYFAPKLIWHILLPLATVLQLIVILRDKSSTKNPRQK
jgi:hypothetical protein